MKIHPDVMIQVKQVEQLSDKIIEFLDGKENVIVIMALLDTCVKIVKMCNPTFDNIQALNAIRFVINSIEQGERDGNNKR